MKVLQKEKSKYEGELAIVLSEVEEYQSLMERFPKKKDMFLTMFTESKEYSAKLLGKINALSKVLLASKTEGPFSC
ncbi:response regulator [Vibrio variabilis]|uniref:Response regulator n=1 Tax=Vibrio variabilis TaxID=990271 RepID=A0ABQ0JMK9_9VIBR|nr:response regulator [Vibrio variabilis]